MTFRTRLEDSTFARDLDRLRHERRRAPHRMPASGVRLRVESLEDRFLLSTMPPVATTLAATAITSTTATLNGSVNPSGTSTDALFQYSTDPTLAPHVVTTLAGTAGQAGSADGTGTAAQFSFPTGISVDVAGNVYVCDSDDTIRKITPAGVVTTFAGTAGQGGSADGTGAAARFTSPEGTAVDGAGNVYVADTFNDTIRKITPAGVVTTLAGTPGQMGSADGTGAAAVFAFPTGVAVDGAGNVYVADEDNDTIRKITPAGVVTTLAGTAGQSGSADGTGALARFNTPFGIAIDGAGNIYVAERVNDTIREITPAGVVSTLAGTAGHGNSVDGTGAAAQFGQPRGVAVDDAGNVYVADTGADTIRRITPAGVVTTLAGGEGSVDGIVVPTQFNTPFGVAVDGAGNVYVADTSNDAIRKISNPTVLAQSGVTGTSPVAISAPLSGLDTGTTYYFRAVATNPMGTAKGAILSFTPTTTTIATTSTQLTASANPSTVGQALTFTATVAVPEGAGVATGTVTFLEGAVVLGTGSLDEDDLATFSTSTLAAGDLTVKAVYDGDASFAASSSNAVDVTIKPPVTTPTTTPATPTALSISTSSAQSGQPVVLTAIVTTSGGSPATGSVTFTLDGVAQPPSRLSMINGRDVATLTLNSLANGNHVVTAAYGGSAAFAASASAIASVLVTAPAVAADGPLVMNFQRFGYHSQPTVLVLTFNKEVDPSGADNAANYKIVSIGPGGTLGPAIGIKRIDYDSVASTVTLRPSQRLNVHTRFELVVDGTSKHALTDLTLDVLDGAKTGKPGSDYVGMIDWAALAGPSLHGKKYVTFWMKWRSRHGSKVR